MKGTKNRIDTKENQDNTPYELNCFLNARPTHDSGNSHTGKCDVECVNQCNGKYNRQALNKSVGRGCLKDDQAHGANGKLQ